MLPQDRRSRFLTQTINIRLATADDVTEIVRLVNSHAALGAVLPRTTQSVYDTVEDWLVAEAEDELFGCVSLLSYSSGLVEVRSLVIQDQMRGFGLGTRLLDALLNEARRRHIPRLFALTRVVSFFERFGFTETDRQSFPEKVWFDCQQCPFLENCDETAVVLLLDSAGELR
jgi:N-acetylglutamate synthase-like GNAT family acetyltransferase